MSLVSRGKPVLLLPAIAAVAYLLVCAPALPAAENFNLPIRVEAHVADALTGRARPYSRARVAGVWRAVIGSTGGRMVIARRTVHVGPGGRVFVAARVPERLAAKSQDLDLYLREDNEWRLRGRLRYTAGGSLLVSKTLVLPGLPPGPMATEIHARGQQQSGWDSLMTAPVRVAEKATLIVGFALDGIDPERVVPVDVAIDAIPLDAETEDESVVLWDERISESAETPRWRELEVDLRKVGSRMVRLRFRSRPTKTQSGPTPGVVWGAPSVLFEQARPVFPVVAIVSLDSLRTDEIGLYGASPEQTPFIDDLFGKGGAVFTQAITQAVTTQAAHMSLLTSLNPCVHGALSTRRAAATSVETLAALFKEAGYATAAFTEGAALAGEFGFDRGFDVYDEGGPWGGPHAGGGATSLDRAAAWMRDHTGEPLFIFVHSYETRPFVFAPGSAAAGLVRYREKLREADEELRHFVAELDRVSVAKESLLVLTTGHGEEFFDHGAGGHGTQLYEETVSVPLMFRGAGVRAERRYYTLVGLIDVAPTILELRGLPRPRTMQGKSVAALIGGGKEPNMPRRFSEAHRALRLGARATVEAWTPPAYSVRDGGHKVIMHAGAGGLPVFEAYNLTLDPSEKTDLLAVGRGPEWAGQLKGVLQNYPKICKHLAKPPAPPPLLSATDREKLLSLGYAD